MYSVSAFLSTLLGYFPGQDIQPSSTSYRQKLTMQGTQSCSVRHMDRFQHKPSGHLQRNTTETSSRRNLYVHSTKKQTSEARQPNLLQQAIKAASRVRQTA